MREFLVSNAGSAEKFSKIMSGLITTLLDKIQKRSSNLCAKCAGLEAGQLFVSTSTKDLAEQKNLGQLSMNSCETSSVDIDISTPSVVGSLTDSQDQLDICSKRWRFSRSWESISFLSPSLLTLLLLTANWFSRFLLPLLN